MKGTKTNKQKRKKGKLSKNKRIIRFIAIVLFFMVIVFVTGYYYYVKSKIYTEYKPDNKITVDNTEVKTEVEKEVEYEQVKGITNVLLIGTDGRTLDENARADSIIIATIDSNNKKIKLTSLFRDTLVNIPGYGENKLNAAMAFGGKELLIETVRETYNIDIDKYIIINFWGFEAIIDQIGGLEIDVKDYQLDELNKYIGEATGGNDCPVAEAGLQVLNGKQALSYARIRKGVGDEYERTERQREVIFKVSEKLRETKPSKYLGIMNKMLDYINTNIDFVEALNLAYTIFKFPSLETEQLQMPIPALAYDMNYGDIGFVFIMDTEQNANILHEFIFQDKIPNEDEFYYNTLYSIINSYENEQLYYENDYSATKNPINKEDNYNSSWDNNQNTEQTPIEEENKESIETEQKPSSENNTENNTPPNISTEENDNPNSSESEDDDSDGKEDENIEFE